MPITKITVSVDGNKPRTFEGREAWALYELIRAGKRGLTVLSNPAPRWSHYIYLLRRDGVKISTTSERHYGPFSGSHGRYRLESRVKLTKASAAA